MALINKIAVQAYRTFRRGGGGSEQSFRQNLSILRDLMSRLTAHDVNLDRALVLDSAPFDRDTGLAPVTFIDIWKDEHFSMSIFILKPGTRLPMHDHPGMHGLIRVIHGRMNIFSYSLLQRKRGDSFEPVHTSGYGECYSVRKGDVFMAHQLSAASGDTIDVNSETIILTPLEGNIHEIRTSDSAVAFFDILAPPYDDHRYGPHQCHYYRELPVSKANTELSASAQEKNLCKLICIPTPMDYWTDDAPYDGPYINPNDSRVTVCVCCIAFSAFDTVGWVQEEHMACKN